MTTPPKTLSPHPHKMWSVRYWHPTEEASPNGWVLVADTRRTFCVGWIYGQTDAERNHHTKRPRPYWLLLVSPEGAVNLTQSVEPYTPPLVPPFLSVSLQGATVQVTLCLAGDEVRTGYADAGAGIPSALHQAATLALAPRLVEEESNG